MGDVLRGSPRRRRHRGRSALSGNTQRVTNRRALDTIIDSVFGAMPRRDIVERLGRARIAYGRVSTMDDVARHPQNRYVEVATPSGPVRCLAPGAIVDNVASSALGGFLHAANIPRACVRNSLRKINPRCITAAPRRRTLAVRRK